MIGGITCVSAVRAVVGGLAALLLANPADEGSTCISTRLKSARELQEEVFRGSKV